MSTQNLDIKYKDKNGIQVALESCGYLVVRFKGNTMYDCESPQEAMSRVQEIKNHYNFK